MTIMRRSRYVPTAELKPGLRLPPRRTWDVSQPGQEVLEVVTKPGVPVSKAKLHDNATGEDYTVEFATSNGLPCPEKRPKAVDWTTHDQPPKASELQEGDILPARDQTFAAVGLGKPQTVTGVALNHLGMLQLTLHDGTSAFRPTYHLDEEVQFPVDMATFRDRRRGPNMRRMDPTDRNIRRAEAIRNAETTGYYRNTVTGTVFRVVRHPFGRGMWPPQIPPYDSMRVSQDGAPILTRPPDANAAADLVKLGPEDVQELVEKYGVPVPGVVPPPVEVQDLTPAPASREVGGSIPMPDSPDMPPPPPPGEDPITKAKQAQEAKAPPPAPLA